MCESMLAIERVLISAFFLTCIVLGIAFYIRTGTAEDKAAAAVQKTVETTGNKLFEELHGIRTDAQASEKALTYALYQYGSLASDVRTKIPVLQEFGNRRVDQLAEAVAVEASSINGNLNRASGSFDKVQVSIARPLNQISDEIDFYSNCDASDTSAAGEDCLFNRYQGISHSLEQTLFQIAKAAPEFSSYVLGISKDSKTVADSVKSTVLELLKPRTKMQKLMNVFQGTAPIIIRIAALFL